MLASIITGDDSDLFQITERGKVDDSTLQRMSKERMWKIP